MFFFFNFVLFISNKTKGTLFLFCSLTGKYIEIYPGVPGCLSR